MASHKQLHVKNKNYTHLRIARAIPESCWYERIATSPPRAAEVSKNRYSTYRIGSMILLVYERSFRMRRCKTATRNSIRSFNNASRTVFATTADTPQRLK